MTPQDPNKGLPEGLEFAGFGTAGPDDYELQRNPDGSTSVTKGPRALASSGFLVTLAEGYIWRFDIKGMTYSAIKKIEPPITIAATVTFTVDNAYDHDSVVSVLDRLKQVPGFVSLKET
jgi:hypothetical protein